MGNKSEKKKLEKAEKKLKKTPKKDKKTNRKSVRAIIEPTPEQRLEMIATAAYYIAERHGFTAGKSQADWQAAEKEIDSLLKGRKKTKKEKS